MSEVTVICCYNNERMYSDFVNALKTQTCPYELIGIDNRGNGKFTSCAAAYNSVVDRVKTKYVVYSHQDILLNSPDLLSKFAAFLERTQTDDILGVAGVRFDSAGALSNILHVAPDTRELVPAGKFPSGCDMAECFTLDECFFGGHTEHFKAYPFNADICSGWHLYAVEACLRTQTIRNITDEGGGHVYVCDIPLVHNSTDGVDFAFYRQFFHLCGYYAKYFPRIKTTCTDGKTDFLHRYVRIVHAAFLELKRRLLHKVASK